MANSVLPREEDVAAALRTLSDSAATAVRAPTGLALTVLRRARRRRILRRTAAGVGTGVVVLSSVAAFGLGRSDYFTITQPSDAMKPTVQVKEGVVFSKVLDPGLGDLVYARVTVDGTGFDMISRVMAQSGDAIACPAKADGACDAVVVNGEPVADPYLEELATKPFPLTVVPDGDVFLLGDNRAVANDSRSIGVVPVEDINGVAVQILDDEGHARAVPGAPSHAQPGDSDSVDPADRVPPASTDQPN